MAQRTIRISDLTQREIPDGEAIRIRLTWEDARKGVVELDVLEEEIPDLIRNGRKMARRGRRPKPVLA
jgi:hypothetical protein